MRELRRARNCRHARSVTQTHAIEAGQRVRRERGVALFALSVGLFTLAIAGSLSHLGLVKHEICAEHGALVEHYGAPHAHGADHDHEGHEAHEPQKHCSLLVSSAFIASPMPTDLLGPVLFVVNDTRAPVAARSEERRSEALLRVAPKTSPPSV